MTRPIHSLAFSFSIPIGKEPPTEFRVFQWGRNETTKGDFFLKREEAEAMLEATEHHGIDLMCDYDHLSLNPQLPEAGKASAWYDLELRDDGLWVTNCKWTLPALQLLRQSEYRYWSPAFYTDAKGVINEWVNLALTNLPATDNIEPLVAAHSRRQPMPKPRRLDSEKPKHQFLHEHLAEHMKEHKLTVDELAKQCGMEPERMKAICSGEEFPDKEKHEEMAKALAVPESYFKHWQLAFEADDENSGDRSDNDGDAPKKPSDSDPDEPGDDEGKMEANILRTLTGLKNLSEARATFARLIEKADRADALDARVRELEGIKRKGDVVSLLQENRAAGKIAEAEIESLTELGLTNLALLKKILDARPVMRGSSNRALEPEPNEPDIRSLKARGRFGAADLEADIAEVARQMGQGQGIHGDAKKQVDAKTVLELAKKRGSVYTA